MLSCPCYCSTHDLMRSGVMNRVNTELPLQAVTMETMTWLLFVLRFLCLVFWNLLLEFSITNLCQCVPETNVPGPRPCLWQWRCPSPPIVPWPLRAEGMWARRQHRLWENQRGGSGSTATTRHQRGGSSRKRWKGQEGDIKKRSWGILQPLHHPKAHCPLFHWKSRKESFHSNSLYQQYLFIYQQTVDLEIKDCWAPSQ